MNRLVIIGNGFDLAHGLPTGYCDFIDWYWRNLISNIYLSMNGCSTIASYEDKIIKIDFHFNLSFYEMDPIKNEFKDLKSYEDIIKFIEKHKLLPDWPEKSDYNNCKMPFKNSFFEKINNSRSIQNWVDIENEYYKLLKDCLKDGDNTNVKKLNEEFEQVKKLLEDYLIRDVNQKFDFNKVDNKFNEILNFLQIKPLMDYQMHNYLKEFSKSDVEDIIHFNNQITDFHNHSLLSDGLKSGKIVQTNLFLNFNYTKTIEKYIEVVENKKFFGISYEIQIHGMLKSLDNQINFGFGDEMDDDYKAIEKKDDNAYLRNIKSFQYLQNSNYKDMLDFIESGKFQVYIMGHSCGLSDRILLNKIFENHNCRSIKVFYHQFDEPKPDGRTDNYTEIVQNISRHFNKKEMMREKIVNKSLCQPLPQDIRFALKENSPQ